MDCGIKMYLNESGVYRYGLDPKLSVWGPFCGGDGGGGGSD
jgi:hypothetical protein